METLKTNTKQHGFFTYFSFCCLFLFVVVCLIFNLFNKDIYTYLEVYFFAFVLFVGCIILPLVLGKTKPIKFKDLNKITLTPLICLILFMIWATISLFFATDKTLALFDTLYRGEGLLMYFAYAIIFISAFSIKNIKFRQNLIRLFICVGLFVSVFLIIEKLAFSWINILDCWFSLPWHNPNHSGYFLTMAIVASAMNYVFDKNLGFKISSIIAMFFMNVALCLNDSFGSELAVCVSMFVVLALVLLTNKKQWKLLLTVFAVYLTSCLLGATLQIVWLNAKNTIFDNFVGFFKDIACVFADISQEGGPSADADIAGTNRWGLWKECFKNMKEKPFFGIGINCQHVVNPALESSRPHNELLQFASTMGIPAGVFYLAAIISTIVIALKQIKQLSTTTTTCLAVSVAYFISSLFGVTLPYTFVFYITFLGLAMGGLNFFKQNKNQISIETNT